MRGQRKLRTDGRQVDRRPSQRSRHPHPRWWTLGRGRGPQGADAHDLCRPPPLQHEVLEDARAQARDRRGRDGGATDHRGCGVRGRSAAAQEPQPGDDGSACRQRPDPPHGHLLLLHLRRRDDAAHRQERPVPLLHVLHQGPAGRHRLSRPHRSDGEARHVGRRLHRATPAAAATVGEDPVGGARSSRGTCRAPKRPHCRITQTGGRSGGEAQAPLRCHRERRRRARRSDAQGPHRRTEGHARSGPP
jgi:hypothetical protein